MKLHIIMHESFESPGAILLWAKQNNCQITFTRLYQNEQLPSNIDAIDGLIIMGGPQSPATKDCAYFNPEAESSLIYQAILQKKFVLGICLGAQLIGEALGAKFERSPHKEIGLFDLVKTPAASDDPIFCHFPERFQSGHWHGDMPGLTTDAVVLAQSDGCPRQIVRYQPRVYGFQCHFEFTQTTIADMIENCGHELDLSQPYIESAETLMKHDYSIINQYLFKFLDYFKVS